MSTDLDRLLEIVRNLKPQPIDEATEISDEYQSLKTKIESQLKHYNERPKLNLSDIFHYCFGGMWSQDEEDYLSKLESLESDKVFFALQLSKRNEEVEQYKAVIDEINTYIDKVESGHDYTLDEVWEEVKEILAKLEKKND